MGSLARPRSSKTKDGIGGGAEAVMMLKPSGDTARRNSYAGTITEQNPETVRSGNCFASFIQL